MSRGWQVDLPDGLLLGPGSSCIFRNLGDSCEFLDGFKALSSSRGDVIDGYSILSVVFSLLLRKSNTMMFTGNIPRNIAWIDLMVEGVSN